MEKVRGLKTAISNYIHDGATIVMGQVEIEEYSHFGLAMRLFAGASDLPFMVIRRVCDQCWPSARGWKA